jgi:hypothetical protein
MRMKRASVRAMVHDRAIQTLPGTPSPPPKKGCEQVKSDRNSPNSITWPDGQQRFTKQVKSEGALSSRCVWISNLNFTVRGNCEIPPDCAAS